MGQKVNPTCLRLHPQNKHFDSCWFSEKRYADSIHKELDVGTYYNGILKQIQYPSASCFLEASPRKCQISLTFLNPKQVREQSFKQLGNVNSKDRRRKQNTLFSARKETTFLYGLLEKKGGSLGLSPSYFFTAPFFQGFKKESPFFSKEKTVKERREREKSGAFMRTKYSTFSSLLQVKERDLQNKRIASSCLHLSKEMQSSMQSGEKTSMQSREKTSMRTFCSAKCIKEKTSRRNYLELKKGVCSNVVGLAISQYLVQRTLSGNFLSGASRFLLLQALFSFLKKKKGWPDIFSQFSQQERRSPLSVFHEVDALDKVNTTENTSLLQQIPFLQDLSFLQSKRDQEQNLQEKSHTGWNLLEQDGGSVQQSWRRRASILQSKVQHHGKAQVGPPFLSERLAHNLQALPNRYNKFTNQTVKERKSPYEASLQSKETRSRSQSFCSAYLFSPCEAWRNHLLSHLRKSSIYNYHIESIISNKLKSSCKISLFRAQNVAQSALFIAEEIVYQLERRNSFRQIKTKFLQELANKSTIKGVRVTCVGRIGGRSKKAQRARGESFKMGQTSLHLFDSKVSFASKTAFTPYGAVGVKVWVCWK